ncbi:MAG: hypothetical protein IPK94_10280 [Saprospiraceae bacterium]|nr:hypothetical protein [Saprospiraceae bacterium]
MFRSDSFNNKFEFTTDIKADSVKVMVINAQEDQTIAHNGPHPLKILTQKKEIGPKGASLSKERSLKTIAPCIRLKGSSH